MEYLLESVIRTFSSISRNVLRCKMLMEQITVSFFILMMHLLPSSIPRAKVVKKLRKNAAQELMNRPVML